MRIAIGGFHTECCTFSPLVATRDDFLILRGGELRAAYPFFDAVKGLEAVPLVRARALPGGQVERAFYEEIKTEFLAKLRALGPWDGVFLHMHGAVNVVGMDDAEGDWIAATRAVVGPDCLIAASYDLHGNISPRVVDGLDLLSAYRTAPHIDWYETLERAGSLLVRCLRERLRPHKAFCPVPVLLPGERTGTEWDPGQRVYAAIPGVIEREGLLDASVLVGYVWADEPRATASTVAYAADPAAAERGARALAQTYWDARHGFTFGVPTAPVDETIRTALAAAERPVVISDSGDNPTAGGVGDVPYTLGRLIALGAPDAIYASLADPAAVAVCHAAGVGATVRLSLGGKLDPVHGQPLDVSGVVKAAVTVPWPLYGPEAGRAQNRQAVVQIGGVQAIVTEQRTPFHRLDDFRQLGIEPAQHAIIVVKVGYLVPELKALAATALLALSPGAVDQDITRLPYRRIRRPMYPFDPDMTWRVGEQLDHLSQVTGACDSRV